MRPSSAPSLTPEQLQAIGIGARYHTAELHTLVARSPQQSRALSGCVGWLQRALAGPVGALWILGGVGTGKTHLGSAIAHAVAEDPSVTVRLATAREIVRDLRDTWRPDSVERESAIVAKFGECDLLVLDDLGHGFNTDAEALQLGEVIDRRYAGQRATIVISSLGVDALATVIGERTHDRLCEGATIVVCNWPSHRTPKSARGSDE